jgi:hypothetical protein
VRLFPLAIALACLLGLPAVADAGRSKKLSKSRHLWVTVNMCDTAEHPDTLGIRASMPGTGRKRERMYMRFRAQYKNADGEWKRFSSGGPDSGWQPVGPARFKARQSGWLFPFEPAAGQRFELRAVVHFQWRRGKRKVVARATQISTAGHNVTIAEPEGYSAATCEIVG